MNTNPLNPFHPDANTNSSSEIHRRLPSSLKFLAGSIGGLGGTLFTYPLDVIRVRMALGGSWVSSLKQGGLFQGLLPTLLGMFLLL